MSPSRLVTGLVLAVTIAAAGSLSPVGGESAGQVTSTGVVIPLPSPRIDSATSVESALLTRRSIRAFAGDSLTLAEVAQLLWAAQGVTSEAGRRTAPSAGALYPLEVLLAAGQVGGLDAGVYRYIPQKHELARVAGGDPRTVLCSAALGQAWIRSAPASIVIAGVYERTSGKYGDRAARYVHIEAGHAAQNVYLQAEALGLGTVVVGAFEDDLVKEALHLLQQEAPLCIMPIGRPAL